MNFFKRDVLILLLVSILLGTMIAKAVSYGANLYFQQTLVSLVGDYGEYDLIVQIREENREEGKEQLEKILNDTLTGATYKEGPAIIGKANFFVALPDTSKNQTVYENLDRIFSSIPGGSGTTIITEPRINIRGVPVGAAEALETEFKSIEGVQFIYRSGGSIGIVLSGIDRIADVTEKVEAALTRNKIIDISFPLGAEPDNPVLAAETISGEIYRQLKPQVAQYVSVDVNDDDRAHLISTMKEIRRFLLTYATKATIVPDETGKLKQWDLVVFQGEEAEAPKAGDRLKRGNIAVLITEAHKDGSLSGIVTQGDSAKMNDNRGYLLKKDEIAGFVGTGTRRNPRVELTEALRQTADLVEQLPALASEGNAVSKLALDTLSGYADNADAIKGTIDQMERAVGAMERATGKLEGANVSGLRRQLDQSSKSMSGLIQTLRLVKLLNPDVGNTINTLQSTQEKVTGFSELLGGMDTITGEAVQAKDILVNLVGDGQAVVNALKDFETSKAKEDLIEANQKLNQLAKKDFKSYARELRYLANQLPNLTDEQIYGSIRLMDKVIEGQVIPGKRLQIMVDRQMWFDGVKPIVFAAVGHQNVGVFEADLGVIEPNVYLQVYQVLNEVQAVLAGLTAFVATVVLLALDHTAVMSVLRSRRIRQAPRDARRTLAEKCKDSAARLVYAENLYGMAVGAILLSAVFFLSGGGIPYVHWIVVPFIGMGLGSLMACATEKITPVSTDELLAGQSLGMSFEEIMREIVIPNGRPGLLQKLNRHKLKFK